MNEKFSICIAEPPAARPTLIGRFPRRALAAGALVLLALGAQSAGAACGSTTTVGAETELDDAITAFNAETTSPCVFTVTLNADIALFASTPPIQNGTSGVSLLIEGNGFKVDGQKIAGIHPFYIQPDTVVTMNELTVTGGNVVGGGTANRGGGIHNRGTLTLTRSTVTENAVSTRGGGIANQGGTLMVVESTISTNDAPGTATLPGSGGGIYSEGGSVTVINSTISNNLADGPNHPQGGGILANSANLTLKSTTITNNFASEGSGVYFHSTAPRVLTIGNTIIADNMANLDCHFDAVLGSGASIDDQGYNLLGSTFGGCGFVHGVNNNIVGDPGLEPLADNGGPTQTHALALDSEAIDAGNTTLPTDQRGEGRPAGAADDIGAFESHACDDDAWTVSGQDALKASIECFNAKTTPGTYTITFVDTIPLTITLPAIDNGTTGVELVIEGGDRGLGANGDIFPGGNRAILVNADTKVTINDLEITEGKVVGAEQGGSLLNLGDLTLNRCSVLFSRSEANGAGIRNAGTMAINDSTIAYNEANGGASGNGGGISNIGDLTIKNSTISNNTASEDGGGIVSSNGTLDLDSVTVTANTASGGTSNGGGLAVTLGTSVSVRNSILAGNSGAEDCYVLGGPVNDNGNNLVQTQTGCGFTDGVNGAIVGQAPLLGPLANNGGPTKTHALQDTSPALNVGATTLTTDQRGHPRPSGSADDMGAFELASNGTLTIRKSANPADGRDFDFTLDGGNLGAPIPFQLDDGDSDAVDENRTFVLQTGQYTVTEADSGQMGSRLISCADANGPLGSWAGSTLTLDLQLHEDIDCTFFNEEWYAVDAAAVGLGTVSCSPTRVWKGQSSTCTAVPNPGFRVKEWTGDCAGAGSNTQCFLGKITKNQSSEVIFEGIPLGTYTVTANVVQGSGTVSCSPTSVPSGGSSTCTAVPAAGYRVDSWGGDCSSWGSNTQCYLTKIKSNQHSTVSFAPLPPANYTANVTVDGGNGSVVCTPTSVSQGGTITCTASPDVGYRVGSWSGACASAGTDSECVLANIDSDQTASVRFVLVPVPVPVPVLAPWGIAVLGLLMLGVARRRL